MTTPTTAELVEQLTDVIGRLRHADAPYNPDLLELCSTAEAIAARTLPLLVSDSLAAAAARVEYAHMTKDFNGDPAWETLSEPFRAEMIGTARRHLEVAAPLIAAEERARVADWLGECAENARYGIQDEDRETVWKLARALRRGDLDDHTETRGLTGWTHQQWAPPGSRFAASAFDDHIGSVSSVSTKTDGLVGYARLVAAKVVEDGKAADLTFDPITAEEYERERGAKP